MAESTSAKRVPEQVYVTEYMHADHAWCHTRAWHEHKYTQSLLEVLDLLKEVPEYRFYIDTYHEEMLPFLRAYPDRVAEFHERLLDGSITLALCGYSNPRPVDLIEEMLVRNITLGRKVFRERFPGVETVLHSNNDVPPGTSQIPQIIKKAGFSYFQFARPLEALTEKGLAPEFVWRAPDGTEMISSCRLYGSLWAAEQYPGDHKTNWESAQKKLGDLFAEITGASGLAWLHRGQDDARPLRGHWLYGEQELDLLDLFARWNEREEPKVRFASPIEYFEKLAGRKDLLPVAEGVVDPAGWTYWHGHLGQESLFVYHFRLTEKLTVLEKLLALDAYRGGAPYPAQAMEERWRKFLRTAGHAQLWLYADDYARLHGRVRELESDVDRALREAIRAAAVGSGARPTAGAPAGKAHGAGARSVTVFHPHNWALSDVREVWVDFDDADQVKAFAVLDDVGAKIPFQPAEVEYFDSGAIAKACVAIPVALPPMGFARYSVVPVSYETDGRPAGEAIEVLEDVSTPEVGEARDFSIRFDGGRIAQLSVEGESIQGPIGELVFQEVLDEQGLHYGPYGERYAFDPKVARVIERGPVRTRLWVRGRLGPHTAEQVYEWSEYSDVVKVETRVFSTGAPGEFRLAFGMGGDARIHVGALYGHESRELDGEPYVGPERLRHGGFYAHRWLDVSDGKTGMFVVSAPGNYGWIKTDQTVEHILLKDFPIPDETWEAHCSGLREGKGSHSFTWAFRPHRAGVPYAELHRRALSQHAPTPSVAAPLVDGGAAGSPPGAKAWLEMDAGNLAVSAVYGDGDALLVRCYEIEGRGGTCSVSLAGGAPRSVTDVDLHGDPVEAPRAVRMTGGGFTFDYAPWEIITLRIEK